MLAWSCKRFKWEKCIHKEISLWKLPDLGLCGAKFVTKHATLTPSLLFSPNMYYSSWLSITEVTFPYNLTHITWLLVENCQFQLFHNSKPKKSQFWPIWPTNLIISLFHQPNQHISKLFLAQKHVSLKFQSVLMTWVQKYKNQYLKTFNSSYIC